MSDTKSYKYETKMVIEGSKVKFALHCIAWICCGIAMAIASAEPTQIPVTQWVFLCIIVVANFMMAMMMLKEKRVRVPITEKNRMFDEE